MSFAKRKNVLTYKRKKTANTAKMKAKTRYDYYISPFYVFTLFVFLTTFFTVFLFQDAKIARVQYNIGSLKRHRTTLLSEQRTLKLNIEQLEALERIEHIARTRLRMVTPEHRVVLSLDDQTNTAQEDDIPDEVIISR